jgi:hypothetical protein
MHLLLTKEQQPTIQNAKVKSCLFLQLSRLFSRIVDVSSRRTPPASFRPCLSMSTSSRSCKEMHTDPREQVSRRSVRHAMRQLMRQLTDAQDEKPRRENLSCTPRPTYQEINPTKTYYKYNHVINTKSRKGLTKYPSFPFLLSFFRPSQKVFVGLFSRQFFQPSIVRRTRQQMYKS